MINTIEGNTKCGAVGVKFINWDGSLQEAGTVVWNDGTVNAYGAGDDPTKPEYCYVRESGFLFWCLFACIRRSL